MEVSRFQESIHSNDCVSDAVELIWSSVNASITNNWLRTLELPIAIDMTLLKMKKVVGWSVVSHDGVLPDHNDDFLERFAPEAEPTPISIDPWARGTVPVRKEIIANIVNSMSSSASVAPSEGSRRSSRSSQTGKGAKSILIDTKDSPDHANISGKIIELDEDLDLNDVDSTASMFKLLQKMKRLKLRDTKGISGEKVNEFESIKEEIGNASKDLKGKKFVIDKEGRVLTVDPVRPESLPPYVVALKASISENSFEDVSVTVAVMKKKKTLRVAGSPALNEKYFKAASTLATSLAGGGQITVINPGVSIQSGDSMRTGETFPSDPKRANREEYLRVGTGKSTFDIDDSILENSSRNHSPRVTNPLVFESAEYDSNSARLAFRVNDVDIFEGSRRLPDKEPETASEGESNIFLHGGLSTVSVSSSNSRRPGKASEKQKRNISLLSGGPAVAGYRDRDIPMGMLPPSERTKLPAPPIGHTTGHGLRTVSSPSDKGMGASVSMSMSSGNSKYDGLPTRGSHLSRQPPMASARAGRQ